MTLAKRIDQLLNKEGYTVKGVQQLLAREGGGEEQPAALAPVGVDMAALKAIRQALAEALAADRD